MTSTEIDELAVQAMQGLLSGPKGDEYARTPDVLVRHAYAAADAMAAERRRRDETQRPAKE